MRSACGLDKHTPKNMRSKLCTLIDALIAHYAGKRGKEKPTLAGYRRILVIWILLAILFAALLAGNVLLSGFAANVLANVLAIVVIFVLVMLAVRTTRLLRQKQ